MATLKINVMSILAIIVMVSGIIAVGLYEAPYGGQTGDRVADRNTYEAMIIIAILLALVVLVVTCADIEQVKTKTFLIYALAALLLLIGIIVFGVYMGKHNWLTNTYNHWVASMVFACIALIASIAGAVAPFVCNKS